jgi:hypothetical protein
MKNRLADAIIATVVGIMIIGFAPPVSAQGLGLYSWAGETPQGGWLELTGRMEWGDLIVTTVWLSRAVVECSTGPQDLDLSSLTFETNVKVGSAPFTIGRLISDDSQAALLIKGRATSEYQRDAKLKVYWTRLFYVAPAAKVPAFELCTAILPVTLQLYAID